MYKHYQMANLAECVLLYYFEEFRDYYLDTRIHSVKNVFDLSTQILAQKEYWRVSIADHRW